MKTNIARNIYIVYVTIWLLSEAKYLNLINYKENSGGNNYRDRFMTKKRSKSLLDR